MPLDNVEVVRRLIEANRSDNLDRATETWIALTDPRIEFTSVITEVTQETYRGHDGLRRYIRDLTDSWKEWRFEVEEAFEIAPDTVLVILGTRLVGRGSGVAVEAQRGAVAVLSKGKVLRGHTYPSREAALEAVGLEQT
jgi:ketosteroid isomerase-like protein